ncbi:MAG: hypothetical protein HY928_00625 [Elusimicrobia bacterium]|nr:hypothetical protein [Elusimicrobiota bacterium]
MAEDGGRLVGSGSFKVDAARAIASLRQRQLPRDFWRPTLLIRLASACGASRLSFTKTLRRLTVRFDGDPIPPDTLREPFGRLAGGTDDPVLRWFTWSVLHSSLPGVTITAASGQGGARAAFRYGPEGQAEPVPPGIDGETVITASWSLFKSMEGDSLHPTFWPLVAPQVGWLSTMLHKGDAASFSISFTEQGFSRKQVPWEKRKPREGRFRMQDGRRTFCRLAEDQAKVHIAVLGTRVALMDLPEVPLPVEVTVEEPDLELDASLDSPVRDMALNGAVGLGNRAAGRFMLELLEHHARAMKLAGAWLVKDRRARKEWVEAMGLIRGDEGSRLLELLGVGIETRGARSGDKRRVVETARMTLFLRGAAERTLRSRAVDARERLRDALWKTPLFFDGRGRPLSLDDAGAAAGVPSMTNSFDPPAPNRADLLWVLSPLDAIFLKRRFPERSPRGLR